MSDLYISGNFYVSELIRDEAVIERFEKDPKAFVEGWQESVRAGLRTAKGKDTGRPTEIHTSLTKQIKIGEEAAEG